MAGKHSGRGVPSDAVSVSSGYAGNSPCAFRLWPFQTGSRFLGRSPSMNPSSMHLSGLALDRAEPSMHGVQL